MNKLYSMISSEILQDNSLKASVLLNSSHPVFEGHFPGNPILPGVCTVQIAKEIMEQSMDRKLSLIKAGNIKYLGFVSPVSTPEMQFLIVSKTNENNAISASVTVTAGGNTICSFKGEYKAV